MKKLLTAIVIAACTGVLALGGEDAPQTPTRGQGGRQGGRRQGGRQQGNFGRQPRGRLVERLVRETAPEDLPQEIKDWAAETELLTLRLEILTAKVEEKEKTLSESPELAPLLAAYQKAHDAYRAAVDGNAEATPKREEVAKIDKQQRETRQGMGAGTNWQEMFRTMRELRTRRQTLETEIADIIAKDENIQKLEAPRRTAAAAFMAKHNELKEKDTEIVKIKAEMDALMETQREIDRKVETLAREKGLLSGGGGPNSAPTRAPAPDDEE